MVEQDGLELLHIEHEFFVFGSSDDIEDIFRRGGKGKPQKIGSETAMIADHRGFRYFPSDIKESHRQNNPCKKGDQMVFEIFIHLA